MKADRGFESRPLRFVTQLRRFCDKFPQNGLIWPGACSHVRMWLGLVYLPSLDEVILCAWRRGRDGPVGMTGSRRSVIEMARALRAANGDDGFVVPRCDECCTPVDLPEL